MSRDNLEDNTGIAWDADPEPDVFEYLVYWTDVLDITPWLTDIDSGSVTPNAIVPSSELRFLFPAGHPEGADYAVVSHSRDATGIERWSTPHAPAEWQNVPLDQTVPALVGPSGGRVLSGG